MHGTKKGSAMTLDMRGHDNSIVAQPTKLAIARDRLDRALKAAGYVDYTIVSGRLVGCVIRDDVFEPPDEAPPAE
jgi:hypothetical protein